MRILCVGDVCQHGGMKYIRKNLSRIRKENNIDFVCVNGENSNEIGANGISRFSAEDIFISGADVITTGNHAFGVKGSGKLFDDTLYLLRPANMAPETPGKGYCLYDMGHTVIAVINLCGQVFMQEIYTNPFTEADRILEEIEGKADIILVDFHAEATSEKKAMGYYLDGRVTAVFGTHTHVQTGDARLLPKGTAYITDVGMTGPVESVLGIEKETIIERFVSGERNRFKAADGPSSMNCFIIDTADGIAVSARAVTF